MNRKLKQALKQNFNPPPSKNSDSFIKSISYNQASFTEVLFFQIKFIRKRVWLGFAFLVLLAFILTNYTDLSTDLVLILSALLPIFSLLTVTELHKSSSYNMAEMELACKYNLSKITLMRFSILGLTGFIILCFYAVLANSNNFGIFRNLIYLSVPYLISVNLSLFILLNTKTSNSNYICSAVSIAVSVLIFITKLNYNFIYNLEFTFIWSIFLLILLPLVGLNIIQFKTSQEELKWNL